MVRPLDFLYKFDVMNIAVLLATGLVLLTVSARGVAAAPPVQGKRVVVGYFTEWNASFDVDDLRPELLTHVNYAFAVIKNGEIAINNPQNATEKAYPGDPSDAPFKGRFRQLQLLKQKHPHLRTLISVGGWGGSAGFSDAALTEESRATLARSCAAFANRYGFDGIDIDWEFPGAGAGGSPGRAEDTRNFTLLLEALRRQLDAQGQADGKRYLLTIAAPAGPHNYRNIELDKIHPYLDWVNLMAYDFAGGWSKVTGFNAPLHAPDGNAATLSADAAVRAYLAAGVPARKIVLGVPFYARAWGGVASANNGLHQPHDGKPPKPAGAEQWTYRVLAELYVDKSARRFWHDVAKVPWLYDEKSGVMVTYDDPQSLKLKAEYVRANDLGGVMIWELSQDDERGALLRALHESLQREPVK